MDTARIIAAVLFVVILVILIIRLRGQRAKKS